VHSIRSNSARPTLQPGERQVLQHIVIYRLRDGKIAEVREYAIAVPAE
jgi:ketosteroid isomerase-like protein